MTNNVAMCEHMRTVHLDEEAYNLLRRFKRRGDSFSDVVKRHFSHKRDLGDSAGGWKDVPEERLKRLKRERRSSFGTAGQQ